jgi:hypothetical protein
MKIQHSYEVLIALAVLLSASIGHAADITAAGSGNWSSTTVNAPWPGGIVPKTNDSVHVEAPFNITVDSTATIAYIHGGGTVTMATGATLNILGDSAGSQGTQSLGLLDTTAVGNTVKYLGNAFWCKHQNYYNLVLSGNGTLYNGDIGVPGDNAFAMIIAGNMTVSGTVTVQQGDDFTINGNLSIGSGCSWDGSSFAMTVVSNTTISGVLLDLNGASGADQFGNVTINTGGMWNLTDVTRWVVNGSLTNRGTLKGIGFGSISFDGTGIITGNAVTIPTLTINGTYTVGTTITLTTNSPTLNGTLVFDIANPKKIILPAAAGVSLLYGGILNVINSGLPPVSGTNYQLFDAPSYVGSFASVTFPDLPAGLSWLDDTLLNGSISVTGTIILPPVLSISRNGGLLTLSWDSTAFPGYSVQAQTNSAGVGTNWSATGSGTLSPVTIAINPTNPPVFFRLSHP